VILVDANLLIYATTDGPQRERAFQWLDHTLNGDGRVALPWPSLLAFVRIVTNRQLFEIPLTMDDAFDQVDAWLRAANVWVPMPTERHQAYLRRTLQSTVGRPRLVSDAHLAALAMEHGLTLCSADADFARFPGLKWMNPLAADRK
jgi:uncharacterized protein